VNTGRVPERLREQRKLLVELLGCDRGARNGGVHATPAV
jgi:hypothetical protein